MADLGNLVTFRLDMRFKFWNFRLHFVGLSSDPRAMIYCIYMSGYHGDGGSGRKLSQAGV